MEQKQKMYVLLDLERTIASGFAHYWKPMGRGYTTNVHEAGFYTENIARDHVVNDFDRQTVAMSEERFKKLAGLAD